MPDFHTMFQSRGPASSWYRGYTSCKACTVYNMGSTKTTATIIMNGRGGEARRALSPGSLTWLMKRSKFLKSPELSNRPWTMTTGLYPTTSAQRHAMSSGYNSPVTPLLLLLPLLLIVLLGLNMAEWEPFITNQNKGLKSMYIKIRP